MGLLEDEEQSSVDGPDRGESEWGTWPRHRNLVEGYTNAMSLKTPMLQAKFIEQEQVELIELNSCLNES
jgi:hypothetical protein